MDRLMSTAMTVDVWVSDSRRCTSRPFGSISTGMPGPLRKIALLMLLLMSSRNGSPNS